MDSFNKENSLYDSAYEFNAPQFVDFDATVPVDESIFDRTVVGRIRTPLAHLTKNISIATEHKSPLIIKKEDSVTKPVHHAIHASSDIGTLPAEHKPPQIITKVDCASKPPNHACVEAGISQAYQQPDSTTVVTPAPVAKRSIASRSSISKLPPKSATTSVAAKSRVSTPATSNKNDKSHVPNTINSATKPPAKLYPSSNKPLSFLTGKGLPPKANGTAAPVRSLQKSASNMSATKPKTLRTRTSSAPDLERLSRPTKLTPAKSTEDLQMEKAEQEKNALRSLKQQNNKALARLHFSGSRRSVDGSEARRPRLSSSESLNQEYESKMKPPSSAAKPASANKPANIRGKPKPTIPQTPKLRTAIRSRSASAPSAEEVESLKLKPFKAKPVNHKIFNGPTGIKARDPIAHVTEPLPIHFATDDRLKKKTSSTEQLSVEEEPKSIRAKTPPKFTSVFRPVLEHKHTKAVPCRVLEKEEERRQKRDQMIKQLQEQERKMREFKANPLPGSQPSALPPKHEIPATTVQPFNLRIDERGNKQQERLKAKIEEEKNKRLQNMKVYARPATVLQKQPFVPMKATAPTTEPFNIQLNSERRAEERQQYEEEQRRFEAERARQIEIEQKKKHIQDQLELMRLRKETVFKPAPVRNYKPLNIQKSSKPLTAPKSPVFRSGIKRPDYAAE